MRTGWILKTLFSLALLVIAGCSASMSTTPSPDGGARVQLMRDTVQRGDRWWDASDNGTTTIDGRKCASMSIPFRAFWCVANSREMPYDGHLVGFQHLDGKYVDGLPVMVATARSTIEVRSPFEMLRDKCRKFRRDSYNYQYNPYGRDDVDWDAVYDFDRTCRRNGF